MIVDSDASDESFGVESQALMSNLEPSSARARCCKQSKSWFWNATCCKCDDMRHTGTIASEPECRLNNASICARVRLEAWSKRLWANSDQASLLKTSYFSGLHNRRHQFPFIVTSLGELSLWCISGIEGHVNRLDWVALIIIDDSERRGPDIVL